MNFGRWWLSRQRRFGSVADASAEWLMETVCDAAFGPLMRLEDLRKRWFWERFNRLTADTQEVFLAMARSA